jgi:hypothetical protein
VVGEYAAVEYEGVANEVEPKKEVIATNLFGLQGKKTL